MKGLFVAEKVDSLQSQMKAEEQAAKKAGRRGK